VYDNLSTGNRWAVRWGPLELGDILEPARLHEVFSAYQPVAVMHFAACALVEESMQEPARYYRNNVSGAVNVLDTCRVSGVAGFVFSSTCAVYGNAATVPIDEAQSTQPVNPYGASKLMIERVLADFLAGSETFAFNLGTGQGYSVRQVLAAVERVSGRKVPQEIGPRRPGDPPVLVADTRRAQAELGVHFSLSTSLERIVQTAWA
jgi:UDP-glucose 4-epimerase